MKSKFLLFSLIALAIASCDDDIKLVGPTIQPPSDNIPTYVDSFQVTAKTVYIDSLYAKTSQALLGQMEDPLFGTMKAGYLCQFYCKDNFQFKHQPINGKIDSINFKLVYNDITSGAPGWVGDSLAPQQVEVYKITTPLKEDFYTNMNPADYCDMSQLMGKKVFTAVDKSVPDSVRFEYISDYGYMFTPNVTIDFPKEFGQEIYENTINSPELFRNQETFNEYFPGLYVTTGQGSGCILKVGGSGMYIYYKYHETLTASDGSDSIVVRQTAEVFQVTPEIIQLSHVENGEMDKLMDPTNTRLSYLKSPAGIYTELTIPIKEIAEKIGTQRVITNLPFSIEYLPQDQWKYALTPPSYVALIPSDSLQAFFKEGRINNNVTTFVSDNGYKANTDYYGNVLSYSPLYYYNFNNISTLLAHQLETAPDKDIKMLVVPVSLVQTSQGSGYYQQTITTRIDNYFEPSGVKLLTTPDALKIGVRSADVSATK